jgi:tyrosyl-tRNA synthetase
MDLFAELLARGLVFQCTAADELKARLAKGPITVYAGFDPTADSLHVGHLVPLIALARFQKAGHRPIALAGGATGMVGDPSGKSEERNLLSADDIAKNVAAIKPQLARLLDFDAGARLVDNADWTRGVTLLEFLRDIAKHFSVNEMIKKDSVRSRLEEREQGISFTEFSYSLLQAFDFLTLFDAAGCELQIGGSDQWGNITAGIDLIRRKRAKPAFGLTMPLITKSDGTKFGKTASGAVWLDPKKTSPFQLYQFWMRVEDADVVRFLQYFTFLPLDEIAALEEDLKKDPAARKAQKALAREMTTLIHGADECQRAIRASEVLYGGSLDGLDEATLLAIAEDVPKSRVDRGRFSGEGFPLVELLTETRVASSKRDARDTLSQGGISVNNVPHPKGEDPKPVTAEKLLFGKYLLLRRGKKNYHLVTAD